MVIKGKARGGASALAGHLERRDTNEEVRVREFRGVTARDVRGALREMDCMGSGASSVRTLYHAAINTAPGEHLTDEQKQRAVERLEQELGFTGQPRIIVEHLKKDREHFHVVFMRIDMEKMAAIPDSHNFRKHEIVARELEVEFGHQRVQGAHIGRDDQPRPKRTPGHDEMQQGERTGLSPQQATARITEIWKQADSGKAFTAAVENYGWIIAKGDKRDFVLVDHAGEVHSLARRVDGAKAADIRQRMAEIDLSTLPSVQDARLIQRAAGSDRANKQDLTAGLPAAKDKSVGTVEILRIPARGSNSAARPLEVKARAGAAVTGTASALEDKVKPKPAPKPVEEIAAARPAPTLFRQIFTSAAGVTNRVLNKAKAILEKPAKQPAPEPAPKQPRQMEKPAAERKPEPIIVAPNMPKPAITPAVQERPEKQRMSPAELDAMLARQRSRTREGPGR